jgi:hypothetical protein
VLPPPLPPAPTGEWQRFDWVRPRLQIVDNRFWWEDSAVDHRSSGHYISQNDLRNKASRKPQGSHTYYFFVLPSPCCGHFTIYILIVIV